MEDLSKAFGRPREYLSEILAGRQPAEKAEQSAAEPAPQAFLDMLDGILVKRLRELVVPHLNEIEHQLHRIGRSPEIRVDAAQRPRPGET
jgi:hypothetical protein